MSTLFQSLKLNNFSPSKNRDWAWCYCFLPALIGYLLVLMQYINEKPVIGAKINNIPTKFNEIFDNSSKIEVILSDSLYANGPVWIDDKDSSVKYLLFSDTKRNRIFKWEEGLGLFTIGKSVYIDNSGCKKSRLEYCSTIINPGSTNIVNNPFLKSADLLVSQNGERSISFIFENGSRSVLYASGSDGLATPTDLAWNHEGNLYFINRNYGLQTVQLNSNQNDQICKEDECNSQDGIFLIPRSELIQSMKSGIPTTSYKKLSINNIVQPMGLAFSPSYSKLYVSSLQKDLSLNWYVIEVQRDGNLTNPSHFFNGKDIHQSLLQHLDDNATLKFENDIIGSGGIKVDSKGNVYAAYYSSILVISPEGVLLGLLNVSSSVVTNMVFGTDNKLYFTAADMVMRISTFAKSPKQLQFDIN